MSREAFCGMSSIRNLDDRQVDKQAPEEEKYETLNGKDKTVMTANGDLQHHEDLATKTILHDKTGRRNIRNSTATCLERVTGMTHVGDSMDRENPIADVLITPKTCKGDKAHQTAVREFKTYQRDDKKHSSSYGGSMQTLNGDKETSSTLEKDNSVRAPASGYKASHGDGNITPNRNSGAY